MQKETYFTNSDGIKVKILTLSSINFNNECSIEALVYRYDSDESSWVMCKKQSDFNHQEIFEMSIDKYVNLGRPEYIKVAGSGKIMSAARDHFDQLQENYPFKLKFSAVS